VDFDDNIGRVNNLRDRPVLYLDVESALKHNGFHFSFRHVNEGFAEWGVLIFDMGGKLCEIERETLD